ncbi:alpha/beta fold hydrolase [Streptomyces sp. URMC 123]|uniref:alpha/beta fold hydrolase n=1 Tax=Streptomyces sp. URMC 123 TaxID=3423403 RepID=UPI003F1CE2F6
MSIAHKTVTTILGNLYTESVGSGPPVLLWHSMLVDRNQWNRTVAPLASERTLILVDGPGHGRSGRPPADFTLEDCADAAAQVLTAYGIASVDWVGSAWGGHVGLVFGARHPRLCRSVVAVATPVTGLGAAERAQTRVLAAVYRLVGPRRPLVGAVTDVLLSPDSRRTDPEARRIVGEGLRRADRVGMHRAMHAMMLRRPDIGALLPLIEAPTLLLAGGEDAMWSPEDAARAARALRDGRSAVVGGAHRLPALERPDEVVARLRAFWARTAAARPVF